MADEYKHIPVAIPTVVPSAAEAAAAADASSDEPLGNLAPPDLTGDAGTPVVPPAADLPVSSTTEPNVVASNASTTNDSVADRMNAFTHIPVASTPIVPDPPVPPSLSMTVHDGEQTHALVYTPATDPSSGTLQVYSAGKTVNLIVTDTVAVSSAVATLLGNAPVGALISTLGGLITQAIAGWENGANIPITPESIAALAVTVEPVPPKVPQVE